jgi:hypothetical protein
MNTTNSPNKYFTTSDTVAPTHVQAQHSPTIVTGTLGHSGTLDYSRSAAAVVSETYVVTTKKR